MEGAVTDAETHQYLQPRPAGLPRGGERVLRRRFGVEHLDADTEIVPALGAKECIFNLNLAFLDPGDVALASDPGYPVYTGGPLLVGGEPVLVPLEPERGFTPDLRAIDPDVARRRKLLFVNYPNNPTGAIVAPGFFEELVAFAREYEILVVHDNAYSEISFDGYVPPSFMETSAPRRSGSRSSRCRRART